MATTPHRSRLSCATLTPAVGLVISLATACDISPARDSSSGLTPSSSIEDQQASASSTESPRIEWSSPNRRLSRFELAYAIEDTLGVNADAMRALSPPRRGIGEVPSILVGADLDTSSAFLAEYEPAVSEVAANASVLFVESCAREALSDEVCLTQLHAPWQRLWKREPSAEERSRLDEVLAPAPSIEGKLAQAVAHILLSPHFYLLDYENYTIGNADQSRRLLKSRWAQVLWSSVPDVELLQAPLDTAEQREQQLTRMLRDSRSSRFSRHFVQQWLRLDKPPLFQAPESDARAPVALSYQPERLEQQLRELSHWLQANLDTPLPQLLQSSTAGTGLLLQQAVLETTSTPILQGGGERWLGRGDLIQSALLCRTFPLASVYPEHYWEHSWLHDPSSAEYQQRPPEADLLQLRSAEAPCNNCHNQLETLGRALDERDGASAVNEFIVGSRYFERCVASEVFSYAWSRQVSITRRREDRQHIDQALELQAENPTLRSLLRTALLSDVAPTSEVVRERKPLPSSASYKPTALPNPDGSCTSFDAQEFLELNCGIGCHSGSTTGAVRASGGLFIGNSEQQTRQLLQHTAPPESGYCGEHGSYINRDEPEGSLLLRKIIDGPNTCGGPMPLAGGTHTLDPRDLSCFADWVQQLAN